MEIFSEVLTVDVTLFVDVSITETASLLWFATYTFDPSGETATPIGLGSVAKNLAILQNQ